MLATGHFLLRHLLALQTLHYCKPIHSMQKVYDLKVLKLMNSATEVYWEAKC